MVNNTQSFINAAAFAKANDLTLYLPAGNYKCTEDIVITGVKHIIFDGTINMATGKVLDISYDSYLAPCDWKITNVSNGLLRLSGLNSSMIEVIKANEMEIYAHGDNPKKEFTAYNNFTLGKIDSFRIFSEGVKAGWINENKFYGGRMNNITIDGNYHHDNNIFYGTMLEGFTLTINKGNSNYFYDVRMEGNNTITFEKGTGDNIIFRSWQSTLYSYLRNSVEIPYTNRGLNNQVVSNLDTFHRKETFFNINSESENYALSTLKRNKYDLTIMQTNGLLYESDLIELINPFGIIAKSDKSLFLIYMYAYDANKNLLLTEQTNFTSLAGGIFNVSTGAYEFGTNVGSQFTGIPVFPNGTVKYIKYRIQTGVSTLGQVFNYLSLIKIEPNIYHTQMKVSNMFNNWRHTTAPTTGTWELGDKVYNSNPISGRYIGWVCIKAGNSGTWRGFGLIE
ncbi:hypothetical protein [Bacillus cihuensis]|uniref:hypothetical protein n=1 Tax=Bacillus cihuensis TaxID=1208599 RepID=UPI0003FC2957|nr:hypothetical protein [Bacillus cihuensis]